MTISHNKSLRNMTIAVAAVWVLVIAGYRSAQSRTTVDAPSSVDRIKRGEYLVTIGGCNDCHTPWKMGEHGPGPDMSRMLSGHPQDFPVQNAPKHESGGPWMMSAAATNTAWAGPWGVSFTANLTPDEDTGIGAWSEDIFINTLRTGKHWGQGRQILPPMPWFNYGKMSDDDLKSVFAYLRSIPPVHNRVPLPLPPGDVAKNADPVWD